MFTIVLIGIYSHLATTPFWLVITLHTLLFREVNARMISSSALAWVIMGITFGLLLLINRIAHKSDDN